jgi:hypothetical protein
MVGWEIHCGCRQLNNMVNAYLNFQCHQESELNRLRQLCDRDPSHLYCSTVNAEIGMCYCS